jgi:hypothetical protein
VSAAPTVSIVAIRSVKFPRGWYEYQNFTGSLSWRSLVQLRRISPAFDGFDVRYVSTRSVCGPRWLQRPCLWVPDANLDDKLALIGLAFRMLFLVLRHRPNIVISSGAAPGFFALVFGKLLGAKPFGWIALPMPSSCLFPDRK